MDKRLYWLALGTFAIGVESFAITSLLPQIASSVSVSLAEAGYLIIIYSLANAFGTPVLAAVTGGIDRRTVLVSAALAFAAAGLWAALSSGYGGLMAARAAMAICAGLYTATAQATGVAIASADHRARAISIIVGGTTLAVAFGAPLGSLVGTLAGWRGTYVFVAIFGLVAAAAIWRLIPAGLKSAPIPLSQRLGAITVPGVPVALLTMWLYMSGAFTVIVYLSVVTVDAMQLPGGLIPAVLLAFGIGAAVGNIVGGQCSDRFGTIPTLIGATLLSSLLQAILALAPSLPESTRMPLFFTLMVLWGATGWAFAPPQASRLARLAPASAPLVLSLNSSALYLGIATGSLAGGLVLDHGSATQLPLVAIAFTVLALAVLAAGRLSWARRTAPLLG
ncbi:MFS transporter [Mangrovicella endophytica]|uniref:MFS transporter n=1 Tax=Mangrovicella endophytica TaxID=2066697 RepID=UPI0012FFE9C4|nr:MFS transporter [Mangrovicella endophytica]